MKEYNTIEKYLVHYDLIKPGVKFANAGFHREMQEQNLYYSFLQNLDVVNIITCRRLADEIRDKFGVVRVVEYLIPGEAEYETEPVGIHYPDRFGELRKELKLGRAGELFLVGAGPLGKTYCSWIKQRGGVAVDIGSVFDGWAGMCTRSYMAGRMNLYTLA